MLEIYERYKKRRVAATSSLSSLSSSETELVEVSGTFKALTDEERAAVSNMATKLPSDRLENGWYLRPEDRPTTERCRDEGQLYILIVPAFTYGNIRADDNEGHRHLMARGASPSKWESTQCRKRIMLTSSTGAVSHKLRHAFGIVLGACE